MWDRHKAGTLIWQYLRAHPEKLLERNRKISQKLKGRKLSKPPWNKGLTKDDPRIRKGVEKRRQTMLQRYGTLAVGHGPKPIEPWSGPPPEKEHLLCELIGYLCGDGSITKQGHLTITSKDLAVVERFKQILIELRGEKANHKIDLRVIPAHVSRGRLIRESACYQYRHKDRALARFLKQRLMVRTRTENWEVPKIAFKNEKNAWHFIYGLFNSDGKMSFPNGYPQIGFACGPSLEGAKTLLALLRKIGFKCFRIYQDRSNGRLKTVYTVMNTYTPECKKFGRQILDHVLVPERREKLERLMELKLKRIQSPKGSFYQNPLNDLKHFPETEPQNEGNRLLS